jgi:RNA polymerase sigma-70 factor (ECF subfamily)
MEIEKLYSKYAPMVLRRCRYLLKDEQKALDAMQEVFMIVLQKKNALSIEYPSSLLYTMATNHCLNVLRDNKRSGSGDQNEMLLEQIVQYDDEFDRFELRSIIDRIFKRQLISTKLIAVLHFVDGCTLEETAELTGMSVSGVRKRLAMLSDQVKSMKGNCFYEAK